MGTCYPDHEPLLQVAFLASMATYNSKCEEKSFVALMRIELLICIKLHWITDLFEAAC